MDDVTVREVITRLRGVAETWKERDVLDGLVDAAGLKPQPRPINTQDELGELADELGVLTTWHEPDEQDVTGRIEGMKLDNAGMWPDRPGHPAIELCIVLEKGGVDIAAVNIATLLAWASQDYRGV